MEPPPRSAAREGETSFWSRLQLANTATRPATSDRAELHAKIVDLEHKVLSLGLYTRTILQLLVDKGLLTQDEFSARIDRKSVG